MPIEPKSIKTILVVRNDRFGEFLLNIPSLRALKEAFVNAKIILIVDPYVKELAECLPFIDEIIEWAIKKHTLTEKFHLITYLKNKDIDAAIILNPSKEFNVFAYLAGIPIRAGYNRKWGFLLTHKIEDRKYLGRKHEIDYNLELVGLVGAKTTDKTLSLTINDGIIDKLSKDSGIENFDNLVAIHPWTSDPIKQWPLQNFRELAQRLLEDPNIKVIVIGGKENQDESNKLFTDSGSGLINLTGKTTLKQLAGLLKRCKLLVSDDSGPVHLACAVNTPVIAIFRNDIPAKTARRWGPWGRGHAIIEKDNLSDITVDEILNKVKELLNK